MKSTGSYNAYFEYAISIGWDEKEASRYAYEQVVGKAKKTIPKEVREQNERLEGF